MIINRESLLYISTVTGKPVVAVFNDCEEKWYFYLSDEFKPANPGNHVYDNFLSGRDLSGLLTSLGGYSHGFETSNDISVLTKINEIPLQKFTFNRFKWIKLQT